MALYRISIYAEKADHPNYRRLLETHCSLTEPLTFKDAKAWALKRLSDHWEGWLAESVTFYAEISLAYGAGSRKVRRVGVRVGVTEHVRPMVARALANGWRV